LNFLAFLSPHLEWTAWRAIRTASAAFVVALAQHPEAQRELRQHIVSEDVGEQAP
jgi:hypothetical protein